MHKHKWRNRTERKNGKQLISHEIKQGSLALFYFPLA